MSEPTPQRTGIWLVGARGGLATTAIVGTLAATHGLCAAHGMFTETQDAEGIGVPPLDSLVFGGHEIRGASLWDAALEIYRETGVLRHDFLLELREEIEAVDENIRPGTALASGERIATFADDVVEVANGREAVEKIRADLAEFRERHGLDAVVVANVSSTEPSIEATDACHDLAAFEAALDEPDGGGLRASSLYTYAALLEGCPFVNFTPSPAALVPALRDFADANGIPYMGNDGKTGETLVKSALAPMFRYRNLNVMSWQGYNLLGDRDGEVLSDPENRKAKLQSKDEVIPGILGYPVHTHVGIDYVPSLHDQKTAWDFIHFRGFLDVKMSLQFIWQGIDSILAAPVLLDLVRFAELARRRGEAGSMTHLASYFKSPLDTPEHDLHYQFHALIDYVRACRDEAHGSRESKRPSATKRRL